MDKLSEMQAFAAIVDNGGFTEAAKKLGISKSAVSKHITSLETRLGATLLNRTTRQVSATEIGQSYYSKISGLLTELNEADAMVTAHQKTPAGTLVVTTDADFGVKHVTPAISKFIEAYPEVKVDMIMTSRFVNLVEDNVDLAIRIGDLANSSMKAKKLSSTRFQIVGSSNYLERIGTPRKISDLHDHCLLHYAGPNGRREWRIKGIENYAQQLLSHSSFSANSGSGLLTAAEQGLGLARLPSFLAQEAIANGRVKQVLSDLEEEELGIYAVYQPGLYTQPSLRAFIDFLVKHFKGKGGLDW